MTSLRLMLLLCGLSCTLLLGACGQTSGVSADGDDDGLGQDCEALACDDDGGDQPLWPDPPACDPPLVPVGQTCQAVRLPELDSQWQQVAPGGDTSCARGAPFYFFVRGGTQNNLLVSFRGGGACWSAPTCAVNERDTFFADDIEQDHDPARDDEGIFDLDNPENPFAHWYMVHIPYCTGDLHWGATDVTYTNERNQEKVDIRHRGYLNASAAIDWIAQRFNAPDHLFITGASAGAYGSEVHGARLMTLFPYASTSCVGDGGNGVMTPEFYQEALPGWDFLAHAPILPGFSDRVFEQTDFADYRIALAQYFKGRMFAHVTTIDDGVQQGYYLLTGGDVTDWSPKMQSMLGRVTQGAGNYRFFVMPGDRHVTIYRNEFYTEEADGVRLRDWIADLAEGNPVTSVQWSADE